MVGGLIMARNNDSLISKLNLLCTEDYDMVVSLVNSLIDKKNSDRFREICSHYQDREPLSMDEIDEEIRAYRRGE